MRTIDRESDRFVDTSGEPASPRGRAMKVIPPWTDWFTPGRFAALLGALIVANFAPVLFGGQTFFLRDFGYFSYPVAHYHRECFWRGELPLWNPLNSCGMPYLAQWNTLTLYPPALIYLLLPLPWSLNLFCLLHLFAGGMGMYFLAHRWTQNRFAGCVAGTLFAFSGFTLNCAMWPNNIAALGAMPWVVLFAQRGWQEGRRPLIAGALIGSLQMLSGAPEMIILTWIIVAGIFCIDVFSAKQATVRSTLRLAAIVLLIAGMAAAQLLPFFELMRASDRSQDVSTGSWSMPGWGWASFFVPLFHSYRAPIGNYFQPGQEWIASYYTGVCGVVLAVVAVFKLRNARVWLLAALAGVGIALALGDNGFLYPALRRIVPQLGFMRFPVKFLIVINFVLPLLAAYAISAIRARDDLHLNRTLLAIAAAAVTVIVGVVWFAHGHPVRSENWQTTMWSGASRIVAIVGFAGLLCSLRRIAREQMFRIASALILVVLFLDGVTHSPKATPTLPSSVLHSGLARFDTPAELNGQRAMLIRPAHDEIYATMVSDPFKDFLLHRQALFGNCNLIDGVPTTDGFFSLYPREQREVWSQLWFRQTNYTVSPLLDFLGVAHVNAESIFEWTNRASALPIATVGQQPLFADTEATLDALLSPSFEPRRVVYLPPDAKRIVSISQATDAQIAPQHTGAHRLEYQVVAKEDVLFVLAQTFDRSWHARVDNKPAQVLRANHAFQSIVVPAGTHQVVFTYKSRAFQVGLIISLAVLALTLLFARWTPQWS